MEHKAFLCQNCLNVSPINGSHYGYDFALTLEDDESPTACFHCGHDGGNTLEVFACNEAQATSFARNRHAWTQDQVDLFKKGYSRKEVERMDASQILLALE